MDSSAVKTQDGSKKIAVILPAYNEEKTIADCMREFHKALPQASIYVINNNSKDRTGEISRETMRSLGCEGKVIDELRQGKGNAVRRAFLEIEADVYLLVDADLTYPANRALDLCAPVIEGQADMVVGDRHSNGHYARENTRAMHGFGNSLVQSLVNMSFNSKLTDIMSGYRVFSRAFVKSYPILVEGFQIETDMTLHALHKRQRIIEIPVEYKDRPAGSFSKLNTYSDGMKVLFSIVQILRYFRPLAFFGSIAAICFIAGLVAAVPVMGDWIRERYIHHVPLAILASALETVAFLMFGIGLVLDALVHKQRMDFELFLLQNKFNQPNVDSTPNSFRKKSAQQGASSMTHELAHQ